MRTISGPNPAEPLLRAAKENWPEVRGVVEGGFEVAVLYVPLPLVVFGTKSRVGGEVQKWRLGSERLMQTHVYNVQYGTDVRLTFLSQENWYYKQSGWQLNRLWQVLHLYVFHYLRTNYTMVVKINPFYPKPANKWTWPKFVIPTELILRPQT